LVSKLLIKLLDIYQERPENWQDKGYRNSGDRRVEPPKNKVLFNVFKLPLMFFFHGARAFAGPYYGI
jgi:hypothetical protein